MKHTILTLSAGLLLAGALCACSDDNGTAGQRPSTGSAINFTLADRDIRTAYDENDPLQINWTDGDKVRIYCDEAEDVKQADYEVVAPINEDNKHTSTLKYNENGLAWGTDDGVHNFYAVYPADDSRVSVQNGIATFTVKNEQLCEVTGTADANGHYTTTPDMANAYMVANLSTAPVDKVSLTFRPVMTTLNVTVRGREGNNAEDVTLTGISIVNHNVQSPDASRGKFSYEIANHALVNSGSASNNTSARATETTFVRIKNGNDYFLTLQGGQSVTFTVFLPPLPINAENQVDVLVHATGDTQQEVTIGGNTDKNGQTINYTASSKGSLTLPWFPTEQNGNNWITPLDDNIYVSQLSIPGTHDAGTGDGTTFSMGKTQELTLDQQFELGIRAFDLRPALNSSGEMIISHGRVATTFRWDQVMERFKYYLSNNPGEFIIVVMRHEDEYGKDLFGNGGEYNYEQYWQPAMQTKLETIKNETNPSTGESYCVDFRPDLTVKDMRGKILFLCRDWTKYCDDGPTVGGYTGWSHNVNGAEVSIYSRTASGTLNIQDCYAPSEDGQSNGLNQSSFPTLKWNAIQTLLEKSRTFHTDAAMVNRWSINHTSGYTGWVSTTNGYRENAANNNVKLFNYLNSPDWRGSTGIVLMDFVGARRSGNYTVYGDLCPQAIIDNNYKFRMKRKGE